MSAFQIAEPPFITALRGIASDVDHCEAFDQRLAHLRRLPAVFERLSSLSSEDISHAVEFLRGNGNDGNYDAASNSLLDKFLEFVLSDDMRDADADVLLPFLRLCALVVDHLLVENGPNVASRASGDDGYGTDLIVDALFDAALRLLYLSHAISTQEQTETATQIDWTLRSSSDVIDKMLKRHREKMGMRILTNDDFFRLLIADSPMASILSVSIFTQCISHPSFCLSTVLNQTFLDISKRIKILPTQLDKNSRFKN